MKENTMRIGEEVELRAAITNGHGDGYFGGNYPPYPDFNLNWVPAVLLAEYPTWYLFEIQPHRNPKGFGDSEPYRVTVDKFEVGRLIRIRRRTA